MGDNASQHIVLDAAASNKVVDGQTVKLSTWPVDLPHEVICTIFSFLSALDLASLSQVCRNFHDAIAHDSQLWKIVYTSTFDLPLRTPASWPQAVKNLTRAQRLLSSTDFEYVYKHSDVINTEILPLLLSTKSTRPQHNIDFLKPHFHHAGRRSVASTLLRASSLFRRCGTDWDIPAESSYARQLSARLHVYSGLPLELRDSEPISMESANCIHPYARSRVYDLRRYKTSNGWGPFMDDKSWRVDWEKVQAIWLVLGYGMRLMADRHTHNGNMIHVLARPMGFGISEQAMWQGLAPNSYQDLGLVDQRPEREADETSTTANHGSDAEEEPTVKLAPDGVPPIEHYEKRYGYNLREAQAQREQALFALEDPYGVTGSWIRIVNFLDYHDLFAFNFRGQFDLPDDIERDPVETAEAFRLILLQLWITRIEWYEEEETELEAQENDWETVDGSRTSSPSPSTQDDRVDQNVPRPSNDNKRNGSISSEDLYHKPPHGRNPSQSSSAENDTANETVKERKRLKWPKVYFEGRSSSLQISRDQNANSMIRGSNPFYDIIGHVQAKPSKPAPEKELLNDEGTNLSHIYLSQQKKPQTSEKLSPNGLHPDDDLVIRWTTFSIFGGEARWRSEGVQIGGLKSARGILGNWFDKDYDRHGPAGPTGFWKIGNGFQRYRESL